MVYAVFLYRCCIQAFSLDVNNDTQVLCLHQSYMWGRKVYIGFICVAVTENEAYVGSIPGYVFGVYTATIVWSEYCDRYFALHIDGLVQDGSISSVLAMGILQSVTNPSIFKCFYLNDNHFISQSIFSSRWRHNQRDGDSNHQSHDCLFNLLFRHRSKETSNLRGTGLCAGNSPGTGWIPRTNAENVSIWWRHHALGLKHSNGALVTQIFSGKAMTQCKI